LSFPAAVKEDMGNALGIAQFGGTAPIANPWKGSVRACSRSLSRTTETRIEPVDLVAEPLKTAQTDHEEHYGKSKR
jgi:hypothetical protein